MGMLDGKVALVTGAGGGLGRAHALLLAKEGASVVVNDLGGARDGTGAGHNMADQVVSEIKAAGGKAVADYGSVADPAQAKAMVQTAVKNFGMSGSPVKITLVALACFSATAMSCAFCVSALKSSG